MSLDEKQKLQLKDLLMKLEEHELQHIYDILKTNEIKYTRNNRGIFFKESNITPVILYDIYNYAVTRYNEQQMYRQINK